MHSLNAAVTKKPGPKQQRLVFMFANQPIQHVPMVSAICVGWMRQGKQEALYAVCVM